jgi:hypothetical protein
LKKNETFKFNDEHKRLSDAQSFSKVYYTGYYKKPIRSKWCNTYIAYHRCIKEDLGSTVVDEKNMEQQVSDSIRKDLAAGVLDITVVAASGANGNNLKGEEAGDEDIEEDGKDQNQEDTGLSSDGVNLPQVPIWYRNGAMKKAWEKASSSQKDAVEEYKNRGRKTAALEDDEEEDDQQKVTRLESILRSVQ